MGGHLDGFFKIVGILGLVACFFCGFAASVNGRYRDLRLNEGERFHSDNAYGATANGVERIEKLVRAQRADPTGNPAGWVAAGVACLVLIAVAQILTETEKQTKILDALHVETVVETYE